MRRQLLILLATAAVGCAGQPAPPAASPSATASPAVPMAAPGGTTAVPSQAATYDIRGRVESLDHARMTVTLDHEAIPGLMSAMKMEYKVMPHTCSTG